MKSLFIKTCFKHLALCLFLICLVQIGYTQQSKITFEKYGVIDGLPEEYAIEVLQDDQGFIWVATQNGLVKYDGYEMKVYRYTGSDDGPAIRNIWGGMALGSDGKIWIAGYSDKNYISSFDPRTESFTNYGPFDSFIYLVGEEAHGLIWYIKVSDGSSLNLHSLNPETGVSTYHKNLSLGPVSQANELLLSNRFSPMLILSSDSLLQYNSESRSYEFVYQSGAHLPGTGIRDSMRYVSETGSTGLLTLIGRDHVYLWDPAIKQVLSTYTYPIPPELASKVDAFEDHNGNLWITSSRKISRIDIESGQRYEYTFGEGALSFDNASEHIDRITYWHADHEGVIMLLFESEPEDQAGATSSITEDGYLFYNDEAGAFQFYGTNFNDPENRIAKNNNWRLFTRDSSGLLWMGTRPNLYREAPKKNQIDRFLHDSSDPWSLPSDSVNHIMEDSQQRLWVGTHRGPALHSGGDTFTSIKVGDLPLGTRETLVYRFFEDSKGQIWLGVRNGLYLYSETEKRFVPIIEGDPKMAARIVEGSDSELWVSILNEGVFIIDLNTYKVKQQFTPDTQDKHGLTSDLINRLFSDSKNRIWLGDRRFNEFGLFLYQDSTNTFRHFHETEGDSTTIINNEIQLILEDDLGRIWIGSDGDGLALYNDEDSTFSHLEKAFLLPSITGYALAGEGKIWIGSYAGEGFGQVGPTVNDITIYGEEYGAIAYDIGHGPFGYPIDTFGNIWLTHRLGLSVFNPETEAYTHYDERDGYVPSSSTFTRSIVDHRGTVWIGGLNGLHRVDPSKLAQKDPSAPIVHITSFAVNDSVYSAPDGELLDQSVLFTDNIELEHFQKDIKFEFVGLHYLRSDENHYSWKLENYDTRWSPPSKTRDVMYTNLDPGMYTFRVKASNADGIWNEEGDSMSITILPPWWQTRWAYGLYALMFALGVFAVDRFQRRRLINRERQQARDRELAQEKKHSKALEAAYSELESSLERLTIAQDQLVQQEKLASLGQLTAGIAHEIKNPLNFVNNFSDLSVELIQEIREEIESVREIHESPRRQDIMDILDDIEANLKKIHEHGARADGIVKSMLQHSRGGDGKMESTRLNPLIKEYVNLAYHGMRAGSDPINVDINLQLDENVGEVPLVAEDFSRVILNLTNNAFDAMKEKQGSGYKAQGSGGYQPKLKVRTLRSDQAVTIEIEDNGPGIPAEMIDKILQPFFTTKKGTQGTGLGLSITNDIVKAHGGEMEFNSSSDGGGAVFTINLPA